MKTNFRNEDGKPQSAENLPTDWNKLEKQMSGRLNSEVWVILLVPLWLMPGRHYESKCKHILALLDFTGFYALVNHSCLRFTTEKVFWRNKTSHIYYYSYKASPYNGRKHSNITMAFPHSEKIYLKYIKFVLSYLIQKRFWIFPFGA